MNKNNIQENCHLSNFTLSSLFIIINDCIRQDWNKWNNKIIKMFQVTRQWEINCRLYKNDFGRKESSKEIKKYYLVMEKKLNF